MALVLKIMMLLFMPKETFINSKMEDNKLHFKVYMDVLSGSCTPEKEQYISEEENAFAVIEAENEKIIDGFVNGNIDELSFTEHIRKYNSAQEEKEAFSVVQGQYQASLQNDKAYFAYYNGWASVLSHGTHDWLLILLVLLLTVPIITSEYSVGMANLLNTTANGKSKVYFSKYISLIIITVTITLLFSIAEIIYAVNKYGLSNGNYPIQTIPQFVSSQYDVTVFQGTLFIMLNRLLGMLFFSMIVFFTACKVKKPIPALFAGVSSIMVPSLMLGNSKLMYLLPLPIGMLNSGNFLRSKFETAYMSGEYITIDQNDYLKTLFICALIFIVLSVFSIFKIRLPKLKCSAILCCVSLLLTGCGGKSYGTDNSLYNKHGSYEIVDNSDFIFQYKDNNYIMINKQTEEQVNIIRSPFTNDATTVLYSSMFADDKYFYRCEQIHSLSLNKNTILKERIVRTRLTDLSEDIIFTNDILDDRSSKYLGLGEYLSEESSAEYSIHSFIVSNERLFLEMDDGIYCYDIERKKIKKITEFPIFAGEWSYTDNRLYYIDELYRLHMLDLLRSNDVIISDKKVSGLYVLSNSIYIRSLTDGGALLKYLPSENTYDVIVEKTGNCFAVDDNNIYYTNEEGALCSIIKSSLEQNTISDLYCSFVYPLSNCDYFYYRAYDSQIHENVLFKYVNR